MDVNAALARIRELTVLTLSADLSPEDADELATLFDGLDEWLSRGGFLPTAWSAYHVPR